MTVTSTIFASMFTAFDANLTSTITTGATNLISAISPLMSACFLIYLLLITFSYWRGGLEEPLLDFFTRMISWVAILTFGMNVTYYTTYVVPFFNGLGDDIATALTGSTSTASALDTLLSAYENAIITLVQKGIEGGISASIQAALFSVVLVGTGAPFIAVAAAFILLAKFSLALCLALGPVFIACAMFPATRPFFNNWISQLANYAILVALFAAASALEVNFAESNLPSGLSVGAVIDQVMMGIAFFVIGLSMPNLAAALAGGFAVSANFHNLKGPVGAIAKGIKSAVKKKSKGGDMGGG
jgi:type IV secretion system protein VirB6